MPDRSRKRPRDPNQLGKLIVDIATGKIEDNSDDSGKDPAAVALAYLVQNFVPAELYRYEQERELSIALLKEWLVQYKFKDWTITEGRKKPVTKKMRTDRARIIAEKLNKTDHWHSHSRGIPMEVLTRDLKLLIDDFGESPTLGPPIRDYYHLLQDYTGKRGHDMLVLHMKGLYAGFGF